jgi:signal transduction histidine kinase
VPASLEQPEEVLVADARGGLTPADQVEGKLRDLLHGAPVGQPRGSAEPEHPLELEVELVTIHTPGARPGGEVTGPARRVARPAAQPKAPPPQKGTRMLPPKSPATNNPRVLAYVADLELEVDRLRRQGQFVRHEVRDVLKRIQQLCAGATAGGNAPPLADIAAAAGGLGALLKDLQEPPGYHPAHDQVIAIALRPLAEQVFRWQQRLAGAPGVTLRLELEGEYVEWFPARLRHILDNLLSNALKYRDPDKAEAWVRLGLRVSPGGYELRVSDNGLGLPPGEPLQVFDLFYRAGPARAAGLGVGLAVVKLLVEQSGGTLTVDSGAGQGTTFVMVLPRYDLDDYLL